MLTYITMAWLSTMLCRHDDANIQCIRLPPQGGLSITAGNPAVIICVENDSKELGAMVAIQVDRSDVRVTIPPHAHPCKAITS